MGSKKRSNDDSTEVVENTNHTDASIVKKKKSKTENMKTIANADSDTAAAAPGVASSGKDMEKKKQRKASDKERKQAATLEKNGGEGAPPSRPNPNPLVFNSNSDEAMMSLCPPQPLHPRCLWTILGIWLHLMLPIEKQLLSRWCRGVKHLLRDVKDTTISTLATEVTAKLPAFKGLDARLREIWSYLDLVIKGKLPLNHEILYHMQVVGYENDADIPITPLLHLCRQSAWFMSALCLFSVLCQYTQESHKFWGAIGDCKPEKN